MLPWETGRRTHPPHATRSLAVSKAQQLERRAPFIHIKRVLCGCRCICFPPSPLPTFLYLLILFISSRQEGLRSQNEAAFSILRQITVFSLTPPHVSIIKSRTEDTFPKHHIFGGMLGESVPCISSVLKDSAGVIWGFSFSQRIQQKHQNQSCTGLFLNMLWLTNPLCLWPQVTGC